MAAPSTDSRVAAMRVTLSDSIAKDLGLRVFNEARLRIAGELRELIPGVDIHWCVSKLPRRTYDVTGIASLDYEKALALAQKMRATRRRWHGYRTDIDWMEATDDERQDARQLHLR